MRKHLSVWMLFVRNSLYKVLLLLVLMAGTETVLFRRKLLEYLSMEGKENTAWSYSLSRLISDAELVWVFAVAFVLVTLILCLFGCDFRGKLGYTLQRLTISPMKIFLWQAVHNAMVYVLLWLVQVYTLFGCSLYYSKMAHPAWVTNQTLFLEVHRSNFWFGIFPMANGGLWVMLGIVAACLGIVTARVPHCQRRRKFPFAVFVVMTLLVPLFGAGTSDGMFTVVLAVGCLLVSGVTVLLVHMAEPGLDEE